MTYKEKFDNETDWRKKALIVELFHLMMLMRHKGTWTVKKTAATFKKSVGLISENLNLARAIKNSELDNCTSRNKALKIIRSKS